MCVRRPCVPGRSVIRSLPGGGAFRRSEDGGIIIFAMVIFVLMLAAAGLAVDLMRFETNRTRLQGTLDRAVLAAADLDQTLPARDVVVDYFEKSGLGYAIDPADIMVDEGLNFRTVSATAHVDTPMLFGGLLNVFSGEADPYTPVTPVLSAPAAGTAEERVKEVEVSLILDVSSSMLSNSRFENLKPAAREFVSTVLSNNDPSTGALVSVSMIAYSAVVNPGADVVAQLNVTNTHDYSSCLIFPDSEFSSASFNQSLTYERLAHFDYGASTNYYATPITRPWCFPGTENEMVVHSTSESDLHGAINGLQPFGNTAIDLGAKWGAAMLDPGMQNVVQAVVGSGTQVSNRPLDPISAEVMKVMVLMTDGQNTTEYDLIDTFKEDLSIVWINKDYPTQPIGDVPRSRFSIQVSGANTKSRNDDRFYWLAQGYYNSYSPPVYDYPQGYPNYRSESRVVATPGHGIDYSSQVRHLSWQDIFATWVYSRVNNELFYEPYQNGWLSYDTYVSTDYALTAIVGGASADSRLANICAAARQSGIVIYTVAFEAPAHGQATLENCASSPNHFFIASGTNIADAFSAIATDIRQLKLTQ
ncbi:hypothetical protein EU803_03430 [Loktanella sp. IMCC34160]|uniref:TadE/TadG family type IV pilus assembly protein n=1 Tax=Loktanella sp. IMCC34160 TaxID=2510646 RepID=UPI00101C54FD|nr:TadE/TadG family type IV pilus assembly protein [Loktanella sp. IMCC34160]RYG93167.1 hypothetical protein EU803_03430 [Loktanella sp. IMCC34160]